RRDTSDESLVVQFAVDVGSPEVLKMLFVLSACDLAAVGPGTLTDWKLHILTDLYERSLQHLAGQTPQRTYRRKNDSQVLALLADVADDLWYEKQIAELPDGYFLTTPVREVAAH